MSWPRLVRWRIREVLHSRKRVRLCLAQVSYAPRTPFTTIYLGKHWFKACSGQRANAPGEVNAPIPPPPLPFYCKVICNTCLLQRNGKKIKRAKEKITSLTSSSSDAPQKILVSVLPLPRKEEVTIGFLSRHICFYLGGAPSEKRPFRGHLIQPSVSSLCNSCLPPLWTFLGERRILVVVQKVVSGMEVTWVSRSPGWKEAFLHRWGNWPQEGT